MPLIEHILSSIAPHICLGCGSEGARLCANCLKQIEKAAPACYRCHLGGSWRVCVNCRALTDLSFVTVFATYKNHTRQLVHELKFERAGSHAKAMASAMADLARDMPRPDVVTYVPTATSRVRLRGYDQAKLLARHLSGYLGVPCLPLLGRLGQQRQVGQSKEVRGRQLKDTFYILSPQHIPNQRILLVDDVITTGSTLEGAAAVLKRAGAETVSATVFARGSLDLD